jgi:hypothetical protein
VRGHRGQQIERFVGSVLDHKLPMLGVDRLKWAVGMEADAALLEQGHERLPKF